MTSSEFPAFGADPAPGASFTSHRQAATEALDRSQFAAALLAADAALAAADAGTPREALCAVWLIQSEAYRWLGDPARAEPCAIQALSALPEGTALWGDAVGELSIALAALGHHERLAELAGALLVAWTPEPSSSLLIAAERLAAGLSQRGLGALAEALYARIAEAPTAGLTANARARVHQALATRALLAGDDAVYLREIVASVGAFTRARDLRSAGFAHVAVGLAHAHFGDHTAAERAFREALGLARRLKLPTLAAPALLNLGPVLSYRGATAEAVGAVSEAFELGIAQSNLRLLRWSRVYLARILTRAGEFAEAEIEALSVVDEPDCAPPIRAIALATLADVLLAQHRPEEALRHAEQALALLAEVDVETGDAHLRLTHAEALHATGDLAGARRAILEAQARLLARAARIGDRALRAGFLERVPENARTLAAAADWGS